MDGNDGSDISTISDKAAYNTPTSSSDEYTWKLVGHFDQYFLSEAASFVKYSIGTIARLILEIIK